MFDIIPPKVLHQWDWSKTKGRNPFKLLTKELRSSKTDEVRRKIKGSGEGKVGRADGRTGGVKDVFRTKCIL